METLQHLKAFQQGVRSTWTVNNFLAEHGPRPMAVYDEKGEKELYKTVVDWDMLRAIKGLVFGLYLEMRHDGAEMVAKEILLMENVPQYLTIRQRDYLAGVDEKFNLTASLSPEDEGRMIVL